MQTTQKSLDEWLERDLSRLRIVVVMIDGIEVGEHMVLVALGIDETGKKHPLGLRLGVTENAVVCSELLNNLLTRGLDPQQPYLFVIDGGKGVFSEIRQADSFPDRAPNRAPIPRNATERRGIQRYDGSRPFDAKYRFSAKSSDSRPFSSKVRFPAPPPRNPVFLIGPTAKPAVAATATAHRADRADAKS